MTRFVAVVPDDKEKLALFKLMAKQLGIALTKEKVPVAPALAKKKPRTKIEQDLVDAYKEALAAERGEVELPLLKDFLIEMRKERDSIHGN
jgi:hypothetical protein